MSFKTIIVALLFVGIFAHDSVYNLILGKNKNKVEDNSQLSNEKEVLFTDVVLKKDYFVNDSIYVWNDSLFDWIARDVMQLNTSEKEDVIINSIISSNDPIEIDWEVLMDIEYKLRYFSEIDMEIYSPVFSEAAKSLDKKTVTIKGFVIPFDEEEDLVALSLNPYSSCFFCGKASPASVISLYIKKKGKRYKIDDFKKFKGTLHLNQDDPNEFYYILRDAEEVKE